MFMGVPSVRRFQNFCTPTRQSGSGDPGNQPSVPRGLGVRVCMSDKHESRPGTNGRVVHANAAAKRRIRSFSPQSPTHCHSGGPEWSTCCSITLTAMVSELTDHPSTLFPINECPRRRGTQSDHPLFLIHLHCRTLQHPAHSELPSGSVLDPERAARRQG